MTTILERADTPTTTGDPDEGATLDVDYHGDDATLRVTSDPHDLDAGARLLCAAVGHVRRRHTRRVHTVLDVGTPASVTLLAALRSRVGTDVDDIVLRRAGSSVMVTLELRPVATTGAAPRDVPTSRPAAGDRPRGREARAPRASHARTARPVRPVRP